MVSILHSALLYCLEGQIVQVEADVSDGMPGMELVGRLAREVTEARERVRNAIKNSGFELPVRKITLNLSPANIPKVGTGFDLAMAICILQATGVVRPDRTKDAIFLGELTLSGMTNPIHGILPLVLCAKRAGFSTCYVCAQNAEEAALAEGMTVYGVQDLAGLVSHLNGRSGLHPAGRCATLQEQGAGYEQDLKNVHGQSLAKRGLEIAVAGSHNILMSGPPGAGKSMLSGCIPSILPPLTLEECLEVTSIYSVAGKLPKGSPLITKRPFVSPHHTVTDIALTGGGFHPRAGLVTLAHKGVLFLDEMPEFNRSVLENLRQPLEDQKIMIARNGGSFSYPADFMLVGAMNPCPCGAYPDKSKCSCTTTQRRRYMGRLSKPLLDRMDLCIHVQGLNYRELSDSGQEEDSKTVRSRVVAARRIQEARFGKTKCNARMKPDEITRFCALDEKCNALMESAFERLSFSARGYHRILKVARTIADLAGEERIREEHLAEALMFYRTDPEEAIDAERRPG
ncbi:MAG: YifB family Mg chelatase-like AAA ATPase [Lachnospiraceae bacterium]|nr:YifB family Mg chelatase-like AAA ATPase [Lachnospiraceae bacterium]